MPWNVSPAAKIRCWSISAAWTAARTAAKAARFCATVPSWWTRRCAIAVGSEGRGLSDTVLALCDETLRIPMADHCESLNAAAAAAVLLWEAYRAEEGM